MTKLPILFALILATAPRVNAKTEAQRKQAERLKRFEKALDKFYSRYRLSLGSELPSTQIGFYFLDGRSPRESVTRIRLTKNGRKKILLDLNDLKGSVLISSPEAALKLVRLRTSPTTWYAWDGAESEVEVIDRAQFRQLPNYGSDGDWSGLVEAGSGMMGVLSPQAFRQGHFETPQVRALEHGYVIERWIYYSEFSAGAIQDNERVRKVREIVTGDGGYYRVVLFDKPIPLLPETHWQMLRFQ